MFEDPGWVRWPVVILADVDAGWRVLDGSQAPIIGDHHAWLPARPVGPV